MSHYTVVLKPEPEAGGYSVSVPALPGCVTEGDTMEEALENARDAIRLYLADLTASGEPIPEEHAAPVEQAKPFKSKAMTKASPSTPGKTMFVVLGVRGTRAPLARECGTRSSSPRSRVSRSAEVR